MIRQRLLLLLVTMVMFAGMVLVSGCDTGGKQSAEDAQKFYKKGAKDPNE